MVVWHPYTQMMTAGDAIPIVRGSGALLYGEDGRILVDAISSWWVTVHGHGHPYIADAIGNQAKELEQVIFAGFTHPQAVRLAERLVDITPEGITRMFFSDNGSTAVEVGLKMAWQYWQNKGEKRTGLLALEHAYHGDTFGAMSLSGRSIFTRAFDELLFDVHFVSSPAEALSDMDISSENSGTGNLRQEKIINELEKLTSERDFAAIILEPLVQGAGGMLMYTPEILDAIVCYCHNKDILVIFDEVMTGFYRTGTLLAALQCKESPDIICMSKGLTGGFLPLSVTAATEEIYNAFLDEDRTKMLFHGHSFTANPLGCAAANASLDLFEHPETKARITRICKIQDQGRQQLERHPMLKNVRCTGTILAMDIIVNEAEGYLNQIGAEVGKWFFNRGILLRPLGNVLYLMPPYSIEYDTLRKIQLMIGEALHEILGNSMGERKD